MNERRVSRRHVLRGIAGTGLAIGVSGCATTDTASESRRSTRSPTVRPSTTTPTSDATATRDSTATERTPETGSDDDSSGSTTGSETTTPSAGDDERGGHTVGMYTELYFDPIGLFVEPGETVSFELASGAHSATAYHPSNEGALSRRIPRGASAWNTETFSEVGAFRNVTFETKGTHDYYCIPHKYRMIGRIVVGEPGGPATESPNPDGDLPDSERIVDQGSIPYEEFRTDGR